MNDTNGPHRTTPAQTAMLRALQRASFDYFVHETDSHTGLVRDKTAEGWPASIAAVGMALSAYPVGVANGWIARGDALQRSLTVLRFLMRSEQSEAPDATGWRGFYYHFLDMASGRRAWDCELSSIDTALLLAGALCARAYFDRDDAAEKELRDLAEALYRRADWRWMQAGGHAICHGWKPGRGFLPWHWLGYDEALILYVLALGAPDFAVDARAYEAWTSTYEWREAEGIEYLHAGPLFIHQMSHAWIDFRGIRDAFMRAHGSDYFENSRRAAQVQQRYAMRNPLRCAMYGEHCWGITASDGPGASKRGQAVQGRVYYDYVARGVPDGPDDGTLAPWAVVASLPFAPEIVLPAVEALHTLQLHVRNRYGFKASFNATFPGDRNHPVGWVSPYHFGINEGPTVMMVENHLSGLPWQLMRGCEFVVRGLRRTGFDGGWLEAAGVAASIATSPPSTPSPDPDAARRA